MSLESQPGAFLDEAVPCPVECNILPYKTVAARRLNTACMRDDLLTADGLVPLGEDGLQVVAAVKEAGLQEKFPAAL